MLLDILKVALPLASTIIKDESLSPIKHENPYRQVIERSADLANAIVASLPASAPTVTSSNVPIVNTVTTIPTSLVNIPQTPYDAAVSKQYSWVLTGLK